MPPNPPHSKTNYGGTGLTEERALKKHLPREASAKEYAAANGFLKRLVKRDKEFKRIKTLNNLLERDKIAGCRACGSTDDLTIDHMIPKAHKGQNISSNKQVLCKSCNQLKGDLLPGKNGWWPDDLLELLK